MDKENQLYRDLQEYLNRLPDGFPATESGVDLKLLRHFFTPEEAEIALQLSMKPEPLMRIYNRVRKSGMSVEELQQHLDRMVRKGTVKPKEDGYKEKHYSSASFGMGGIMSVQVERVTKDLYENYGQYRSETGTVRGSSGEPTPPLRTIPVEKSIPLSDKYKVGSYDDVRKIIQDVPGPIAVANCICRHTMELVGGSCVKTDLRETCLIIGPDHARHYVDMGVGRFVTKEEMFDILDKIQEAGLVLQPENSQRPEAICCCCGDCCVLLKVLNQHPRPVDMYITNYYAEVDRGLCNGCQECIEKCQMNALTMADGVAEVNLDRCIGCGNCVVRCPENAVRLLKKEPEKIPVKDKNTFNMTMLADKVGRWNMTKIRMRMLLGLKV